MKDFLVSRINGIKNTIPIPNAMDIADKMKSQRVLKSHMPAAFLPDQLWTVKPKVFLGNIYNKNTFKYSSL